MKVNKQTLRLKMEKLNAQQIKGLLTPVVVEAAVAYLKAKALLETIEPVVVGYKTEVLAKHRFTNKGEMQMFQERSELKKRYHIEQTVVLNYKYAYKLSAEDYQVYLDECKVRQEAARLSSLEVGGCPLEDALRIERIAGNHLIDTIGTIINLPVEYGKTIKFRGKLIDLTLKLLGAAGLLSKEKFSVQDVAISQ